MLRKLIWPKQSGGSVLKNNQSQTSFLGKQLSINFLLMKLWDIGIQVNEQMKNIIHSLLIYHLSNWFPINTLWKYDIVITIWFIIFYLCHSMFFLPCSPFPTSIFLRQSHLLQKVLWFWNEKFPFIVVHIRIKKLQEVYTVFRIKEATKL